MTQVQFSFWLTVVGTFCWALCFWWMHRISKNQNSLLAQLTDQAKRIERFSKIEHDLIKQVHPQVGEIKESITEVIAAVKENTQNNAAALKENSENQAMPKQTEADGQR